MPLEVGKEYTRVEVQQVLGFPNPTHQGKWATGYTSVDGVFFVFANIGGAGRTGHDYPNEWEGDVLHWCAKGRSTRTQPQILSLLDPETISHIFTRHGNRDRFVYHGVGTPTDPRGSEPVMVTWTFGTAPERRSEAPAPSGRTGPLHAPYRKASSPQDTEEAVRKAGVLNQNPALVERALKAHSDTQNALAEVLRARGMTPLSPKGNVDYDIAWREGDTLALGEVKSITHANQVAQLRTGVGQLLDYAAELAHHGEAVGRLFLVLERKPSVPEHWERVCHRAGITLVYGPMFVGV